MLGAVGQLLPVALAAALSSVPITIMLLILLSPKRQAAAIPFLVGCVVGMTLVVTVAAVAAHALPPAPARRPSPVLGVIEIVVGLGLAGLGIRSWLRHLHSDAPPKLPSWAAAVDGLSGGRAFGVGLLMAVRPKNLLLATVVGVQLHVGPMQTPVSVALGICYVVLATSTVTIPILLTVFAPQRMEPRLGAASRLLAADGPVASAIIMILIGTVVLGNGVQTL